MCDNVCFQGSTFSTWIVKVIHNIYQFLVLKETLLKTSLSLLHCAYRCTASLLCANLPSFWTCLHEIEHFSSWFAVKCRARAGLNLVSFSSESKGAVTEGRGEGVGEQECRRFHLLLLLLLLLPREALCSSTAGGKRHTWKDKHIWTQALSYKCMFVRTCRWVYEAERTGRRKDMKAV